MTTGKSHMQQDCSYTFSHIQSLPVALSVFTISYDTKKLPVTVTILCHSCRSEACPETHRRPSTRSLNSNLKQIFWDQYTLKKNYYLGLFAVPKKENNPIKTSASIENSNKALPQKHFKLYYITDSVFKKGEEHYFPSLSSFTSFGSWRLYPWQYNH